MKKLRILKNILRDTHSDKILFGYLSFILIDALIIWIAEPSIERYADALWYCYEVISTTGFGEIVAVTLIGRISSVLLTAYSLIIIAIVTGVVTNFYIQITQLRQKDTVISFLDRLEKLPQLSEEELKSLSEEAKAFRERKNI